MKSLIGIAIVLVVLFIYNLHVGPDVVGLAVVTLCLWHGLWRMLDHFEKLFDMEERPLISAVVTISAGTALAFLLHRFHPKNSVEYIEKRF